MDLMSSTSGNSAPARSFSPFQAISWIWDRQSTSVSPSPVQEVGLNILNRSSDDFEELDKTVDLKIRNFHLVTPYHEITPLSIPLSPRGPILEPAPLNRSVSFSDEVTALLITPRAEANPQKVKVTLDELSTASYEPTKEEILKYIDWQWGKGNLQVDKVIAREALINIKKRRAITSQPILQLNLSN